jgi:predicted PurR-regulated permease PerM
MPRTPGQRTHRAEGEEARPSAPVRPAIMNRRDGAGDPPHTDPGFPPTLPTSAVVTSADGPEPAREPNAENRARPMTMFRWGAYVSLGALAVFAAAAAVYTTQDVLVRVLIALFVAISLDPAVRMLTRRGMRRGLAVLLIFLVAGGLVAAFLVSVIPAMVHQFQALVNDFPGYLANLQERSARFRGLSDRFHLTSRIQDFLGNLPGQLGSGLLGFTRRLFGALFSTLTVVVLTIYFMADLPRLRHGVMRLFPHAHRAKFGRISDVMVDKVGAYMIGNLLISLAAGLATFVVLEALGVPFAVPLAFVVALCDLIPMIGATLGAVVCVLATLLTTELWPTTVIVAIFFVAYQQLENYLIAPRILRHTVSLSAAAVLLAGLIGGTVLGLVGALMAIPIAAGLKVVLSEQLHARDSASGHAGVPGDSEAVSSPEPAGQAEPPPADEGPRQQSRPESGRK